MSEDSEKTEKRLDEAACALTMRLARHGTDDILPWYCDQARALIKWGRGNTPARIEQLRSAKGAARNECRRLRAEAARLREENARLREALEWCSRHAYAGGETFGDVPLVRAALAPPAPAEAPAAEAQEASIEGDWVNAHGERLRLILRPEYWDADLEVWREYTDYDGETDFRAAVTRGDLVPAPESAGREG